MYDAFKNVLFLERRASFRPETYITFFLPKSTMQNSVPLHIIFTTFMSQSLLLRNVVRDSYNFFLT